MKATDRLRAMLDERGVEWTYGDGTVSYANDGHWCHAWAYNDDTMCVSMGYFTPEQAIAATLGAGTCHIIKRWSDSDFINDWKYLCSECGCPIPVYERDEETGDVIRAANFCSNCGAKVEKVES